MQNKNNLIYFSLGYYVRALMFNDGKLIKKKKSTTSEKLIWGDQETLTFDLMLATGEQVAFMVVLSVRNENSTFSSPSSPETPEKPETVNGSKKSRNIGHCVIGKEYWQEMIQQPRNQIVRWIPLY